MNVKSILLMLKGALLTLEISGLGICLGLVGGTLLGVCNAKRMRIFPLHHLISAYVLVIRGTPLFVQILILYFGLPSLIGIDLSPFAAGVLAIGINSTAYLAETVRSGLNAIPIGQWEAAQVLGYSNTQTLRFVMLPQAVKTILPSVTNELVSLIKESSILMIVGVPELTKVSKDIVARELKPMEIYLMCAVFYFVMTSSVTWIAKKWERASHAY